MGALAFVLASCGPSWPLGRDAHRVVSTPEPPRSPLEKVAEVVLADVGPLPPDECHLPASDRPEGVDCTERGVGVIAVASEGSRAQVVWAEREGDAVRARWAALDDDAASLWTRELPFVPIDFGLVGGRAVFVRSEERGITVCPAPTLECQLVSPLRHTLVSFGPREVVFDFGVGAMRWKPSGELRAVHFGDRHLPWGRRIGPCGERWVVAGRDVRPLDRLGASLGRVESFGGLAIVGATTFALPRRGRTGTNLCTGQQLDGAFVTGGFTWRSSIAVFAGTHGLASVRVAGPHDGRFVEYDHAGESEVLVDRRDFSHRTRVMGAHVDRRSRLWLLTLRGGRLSVEIYRGSTGTTSMYARNV